MDYHRLPHHTMRAGSQGTLNALELARAAGARFLLASTSEVYGDPLEHPQSESYLGNVDCRGPRSVYDESKRFAEAATSMYRRSYGVRTSIARIFNTYGPRMREDEGRMVPTFITQCLRGTPLTVAGDGQQTRSLCYVEDLVEGLLRLADSGHPGPVNLGNPDEHRVIDYAQIIRELTGSRSTIRHVRLPTDDPRRRRPDISLAQRVLGWSPTIPLNEGLAKTIDWYRTPRAPVENGGFAGLEVDAASLSHTAAPS
jgi:dTDP-glucose 4,6-dehydratase